MSADLRVFPDGKLPAHALGESQLIASLKRIYSQQLEDLAPKDSKSLKNWKRQMLPAWEHALQLQHVSGSTPQNSGESVTIRRRPDDTELTLWVREPAAGATRRSLVVLRVGGQKDDVVGHSLHAKGATMVDLMIQRVPASDEFRNYFHTYNRTYAQDTVANIKVAAEYLRDRFPRAKLVLLGQSKLASRATLLAAPLADAVAVDCFHIDESTDADLLSPGVFFPGLRRLGSFQGIAALAAPNPLFIHNFKQVDTDWLTALYDKDELRVEKERASDTEIADWILSASK